MTTRWTFYIIPSLLLGIVACRAPESNPDVTPEPVGQSATEPTPPSAELEQIKTRLEAVKTELFERGEYNCRVQPSCDWCALHEGSCSCFSNVQAGDAVCPGCGLGWHNGQGIVDGIDPDDVKWNITHEHPAGGHQH
jgi:hypothetical protein